ncbi:hypothetical protein [Streptococcus equinus]
MSKVIHKTMKILWNLRDWLSKLIWEETMEFLTSAFYGNVLSNF